MMFGVMLNKKEVQEMEYLIKKELEELLLDLEDERLDGLVRRAMEERYQIIFRMYSRFAKPKELSKYIRNRSKQG
jgi:glutamyl-tRNA reductase